MGRTLRIAGRDVTRMGLGTNRLSNTPESAEFIRSAAALGVGMIDTAHLYTGGASEQAIGAAHPEGCVVATKGGYNAGDRETLRTQVEQSLRSLNVETIDVYYLHRIHPGVPVEESVAVLKEFQDEGKIAHIGLSQAGIPEIERARKVVPVAAVQNHYNLTERKYDDVIDYCADQGIVFVPFFPLKGDPGDAVRRIAAARGVTETQIALAWLLKRSPAVFPIPGTLSAGHLRENLAALDIDLSDEEFEAVGAAH